ncbi:unnamed protein product [Paramecium sonneborni]|uniref:GOLD domain-containing protein n=1 Tax=Paramecium sonneborni TaxID=65129 RepID=A0A8S1P4Q4_9CILI|nr:unnamed protein product [Paramecium sonneborni]
MYIALIFIGIVKVIADNFGFIVQSGEQQCLQDQLLKGQMMALQIIANSTEFEFTVEQGQKDPQQIESRKNEILIKYTLTMLSNEYLKYCFRVFGSKNAKFDITYKKGDETVDREQMANKEDLDLIDGYLKQLDRVFGQMKDLNRFQKGSQENNQGLGETLGLQMTTFTMLTLLTLCISTYVLVKQIKVTIRKQKEK